MYFLGELKIMKHYVPQVPHIKAGVRSNLSYFSVKACGLVLCAGNCECASKMQKYSKEKDDQVEQNIT